MLYHKQNYGGIPWVIYQQHSVRVEETDFPAEVPADATAAHWSSFFFSAAVDAAEMAAFLADVAATTASGSSFSYSAAVDAVETMDAATVLADAAAVEMIVAAANS